MATKVTCLSRDLSPLLESRSFQQFNSHCFAAIIFFYFATRCSCCFALMKNNLLCHQVLVLPEDETSPRPSIWTPEVTLVPRGEVLYLKVVMMIMMMAMMLMVMMVCGGFTYRYILRIFVIIIIIMLGLMPSW